MDFSLDNKLPLLRLYLLDVHKFFLNIPENTINLVPMKKVLPSKRLIIILLVFLSLNKSSFAAIEPIAAGSFIVNMGVTPQTYGNGVKPWGMIHDLIKNYRCQVKWVINPTKGKDGIDFTFNGVSFRGGTFIIPNKYRTAAVNARIAYWQTQGVVGSTIAASFSVDVTYTLKYTPRWTFDFQNGNIALDFLKDAGIPSAEYPKKLPSELNSCDDLFVMPHADPTWATHSNLFSWNQSNRGWIWAGCHAVSVMENLINPTDSSQTMNFLSQKGLVMFNNHSDGIPPYQYRFPTDPEMQFMGVADAAMQNGSEQIFLPKINTWRPTTKVAAYSVTHPQVPSLSPGEAAAIVYGRAFGDNTRGQVMYEGGHDINKGNADAVSALRAFFNFSYLSVYDKAINPSIVGPINVTSLNSYTYRAVLPVGNSSSNYTYRWTSSCGGTFSSPFDTVTVFTAPLTSSCMECTITCVITDGCGRTYFQDFDIEVCSVIPPIALDRLAPIITNHDGTGPQPICNAVPMAGTDEDGFVVNYILTSLPANGVLFYDHDSNPSTADIAINTLPGGELILTATQMKTLKFDPVDNFAGNVTFNYTVADNSNLKDLTPAVYTIPVNTPPQTITKICTPVASNAGKIAACAMAATDNGTIVSYTITSLPPASQCVVFINNVDAYVGQILTPLMATQITYKPSGTYVGYAEIMYTATDNQGAIDLTPATLTLQLVNQPPEANDVSSNTIANPVGNIAYAIPALSATDSDGAVASYVITSIPAISQGSLYYNNSGANYANAFNNLNLTLAQSSTLKFDPADTFTGSASFQFTAKDNQGLTDNTPATFHIPVQQAPPVAKDTINPSFYAGGGWKPMLGLSATNPGFTITSYKILSVPDGATEGKIGYGSNITIAAGKVLTPAEAATMKFDPKKGFTGVTSFTYTCTNNIGLTDLSPAIVLLPVHNTAPVAFDKINAAIANTAGQTTIVALTGTDPDEMPMTGHKFTITSLPNPAQGILYSGVAPVIPGQLLTVAQSSALKFDPAPDSRDTAIFTYSVTDECGMADPTPATFKIPISTTLMPPVSTDTIMAAISVRQVANFLPALNGTDVDGTVVSFKIQNTTNANDGILYLDGQALANNAVFPFEKRNQLYFIPSGTFTGTANIKYKSIDNDGLQSQMANVYIPSINQAPIAFNRTLTDIKKNTTVPLIGLEASDSDGVIISYTILTTPTLTHVLQCDLNGTNTYTNVVPNQVLTPAQASRLRLNAANNLGISIFTYLAQDNSGAVSNIATYTIPVAGSTVNQIPFATNIKASGIPMNAGQTLLSPLIGTDLDGSIASFAIINIPPVYYGTLFYNTGGNNYDSIVIGNRLITTAQATTLKFRPSGIYAGNVTFTYTTKDNNGATSSLATYSFPVTAPDPVALDITNAAVPSNSGPVLLQSMAATTMASINGFYITDLPSKSQGILVTDGSPVTTGQLIPSLYVNRLEFDPEPNFSGNASFKYTAVDNLNNLDKTPATFTIPVTNTAPFADEKISQVITNTIGTPAQAIPALSGYDYDGVIVSYTIKSLPTNGVLFVNNIAATVNQVLTPVQAAKLSFDPVDNFNSATTFTYSVRDNSNNNSANAVYTIVANVPPTTNNIISPPFLPTTPRTAIPALVGWDDVSVVNYTVLTLPAATAGKLFLNNVEVTNLSQVSTLSGAQVSQFSFLPASTFAGAIFTYTATDNLGIIDVTPAVYTIPQNPYGANTPLPIDLMTFSGKAIALDNILNWSTSQEANSKQIEIERSSNGIDFSKIGVVAATGNSSSRTDYSYNDKYVPGGVLYYRLKLIDIDGQFKYSIVLVIKRADKSMVINKVMPNPFNDKFEIELQSENSQISTLNVYNLEGRVVKTQQVKTNKGVNRIQLNNLGNLGSGTYILTIKNDEGEVKAKLVKIAN